MQFGFGLEFQQGFLIETGALHCLGAAAEGVHQPDCSGGQAAEDQQDDHGKCDGQLAEFAVVFFAEIPVDHGFIDIGGQFVFQFLPQTGGQFVGFFFRYAVDIAEFADESQHIDRLVQIFAILRLQRLKIDKGNAGFC